jgi:4-hydroxybenzoate polyprenyltransferase
MKTFIRWFILYPITLPLLFIYALPTVAVYFLWEWIEEKRNKGFDNRGARALRRYGIIISKPFFFLTEVDRALNVSKNGIKL